ncbi:predicted GPI-anchored protein 58 [Miscanthus floridulus]|uniref:predicted GPI-anchored protein 58 n=1 Tax=Miscanthus floridulus TaxID=154761 RepID=UPI0034573BBB
MPAPRCLPLRRLPHVPPRLMRSRHRSSRNAPSQSSKKNASRVDATEKTPPLIQTPPPATPGRWPTWAPAPSAAPPAAVAVAQLPATSLAGALRRPARRVRPPRSPRRGPAPPSSRFRPSPSRDFALACPCSGAGHSYVSAAAPHHLRPPPPPRFALADPCSCNGYDSRSPAAATAAYTAPSHGKWTTNVPLPPRRHLCSLFPLNFYALDSRLMGAATTSGGACRVPPLLTAAYVRPTATSVGNGDVTVGYCRNVLFPATKNSFRLRSR